MLVLAPSAVGELAAQQRGGPGWDRMGPGMMGQGSGPGMMGQESAMEPHGIMGMGCPMMASGGENETLTFAEGRIAFLKAELKITEAQKDVWEAYAQALKNNLETMRGMHKTMLAAFEAKNPVERLDAHIAAMETRLGALKQMQPALLKLHGALDEGQRRIANEVLTGVGCMI